MSKHTPITVGVRVEELSHSTPEYDALWRRLLASTPYRSSVRYLHLMSRQRRLTVTTARHSANQRKRRYDQQKRSPPDLPHEI